MTKSWLIWTFNGKFLALPVNFVLCQRAVIVGIDFIESLCDFRLNEEECSLRKYIQK